MRVTFAVWPNPAHLYPLVPLAWALQSAGHEVRVASHAALADTTASVGLPPVALGDPEVPPMGPGRPQPRSVREGLDRVTRALDLDPESRDVWDVFYMFMLPSMWDFHPVGATAADPHPVVDDLVGFVKDWKPDLVLWDPCFPAGGVAARAAGVAHGRLLWGLDYFGWTLDRFAERRSEDRPQPEQNPFVETVRASAERHGVEVDDDLLLGQFTVDPTPAGVRLQTSALTVPLQWVPYAAQSPLPSWLQAPRRRRIGLSLGLSQRLYFVGGWDHVPNLLESVSDLDLDVVATLNAAQLADVGTLPGNVRAVDYLPLQQLLPTCDALIHHGGMGTYASAAAFGVPQLITDSDEDNGMITVTGDNGTEWSMTTKHIESSVTARHVARIGAGVPLDIRKLTAEDMREQILRVLDEPSYAAGAAALRRELQATPSPVEAIPLLQRLASETRS